MIYMSIYANSGPACCPMAGHMSEIRNKELQYCKGTQKLRERNIAVYINHRINRRETLPVRESKNICHAIRKIKKNKLGFLNAGDGLNV